MDKHTPGPWSFTEGDRERRGSSTVHKASDKDFQIALVTCEWSNDKQRIEDIANVRLIAAAPDLVSSLVFVRKYLEMKSEKGERIPSQLVDSVCGALAKAGVA